MKKIDPALQERLATLISSMGYELLGGELLKQGHQVLLRLYIDNDINNDDHNSDHSQRIAHVTVDDCSRVSRQVSAMLDVEETTAASISGGRYILEVSSPGINRPLFALAHFHKHVGEQVKIKLQTPINQRRQYQGQLKRVEDENIFLVDDVGQETVLPYSAVEKAHIIGKINSISNKQ